MFLHNIDHILSLEKIVENIFRVLSLGFKEQLTEWNEHVMDGTSTKN